jgi:hypothetical protein
MQAGSAAMFTAVVPKPFPLGFELSPVKGFLCEMTENMQADGVQNRQMFFVRYCLKTVTHQKKRRKFEKRLLYLSECAII